MGINSQQTTAASTSNIIDALFYELFSAKASAVSSDWEQDQHDLRACILQSSSQSTKWTAMQLVSAMITLEMILLKYNRHLLNLFQKQLNERFQAVRSQRINSNT